MRFAILALYLVASSQAVIAQTADVDAGRTYFADNCAPCHGSGAEGDGPMAGVLSVAPPDLTMLRDGDTYPMADVVRRIDGRDMLLAHGGPMPLFAYILEDRSAVIDDPDGVPIFTSQAVLDIAAWLETVQR